MGRVFHSKDIDPEALLLNDVVKKKIGGSFTVYINEELKEVENIELKKQVVQNIMIHELLHLEKMTC